MNTAQAVQKSVFSMPPGQLFGYQELPRYAQSPSAVVKAVSRLVEAQKLKRLSKGIFYVPKEGLLGEIKPQDDELLRVFLHKDGKVKGYITGLALYNKLGLTTQIPRTISVAYNGGRQEKDFGTIRVKTVVSSFQIDGKDTLLLQYLDVLKDIKTIPDTDANQSLGMMRKRISGLSNRKQKEIIELALNYYAPQVRALLGLLLENLGLSVPKNLSLSLNPTTIYKLNLDQTKWPQARDWNIR